jgi:hypothetical protein
MSWQKESILVLVEAAPNWSDKYRSYLVCTGGVSQTDGWRRLYPMPLDSILGKIHRWDLIEVETTKPDRDPRVESRKINPNSIVNHGKAMEDREEQRVFLNNLSEASLDTPIKEKRSITIIKPEIVDFHMIERKSGPVQLTLNGKAFMKQPYGAIGLFYKWRCQKPCQVCSKRPHVMECFDWGANILWKRYETDREKAKEKVTEMCYWNMKEKYDAWFALGTHSRYPFSKWMIVGILWMKK